MTLETGTQPTELSDLRQGDRFSLSIENLLHIPVEVRDMYIPNSDMDVVRLNIEVPRYWHGGKIPVRVEAWREFEEKTD